MSIIEIVTYSNKKIYNLNINRQIHRHENSSDLYLVLMDTLNEVENERSLNVLMEWNIFNEEQISEIVRVLSTKKIVKISLRFITNEATCCFYKLLSNPHIQEIILDFKNVKGMFRDDIKFKTGVLNKLSIITPFFSLPTTFFDDFSFMEKFGCIETLGLSNLQITKKGFESLVKTIQKLKIQNVQLHSLKLSEDLDSLIYYDLFKIPLNTIYLRCSDELPDNFFENMFLGISNQTKIREVTVSKRDLQNESNILNHLYLIKSHVSLRHLVFLCRNDEFSIKVKNYTDKIMARLNSKESEILVALCSPFFILRLRSSIPQNFPIPLFRVLDEMLGRV